jgi:putative ABC transport system substrate-binding protein
MKRREFIAATAAVLVSPGPLRAEVRRQVGFLAIGDASGRAFNQSELALFDGCETSAG